MRLPNLNTLRMFDAAARHLNFRKAAEELHLTQGAVAQQVRRLEADLALPLFHRLPRGLSLTEAGRRYHGRIRQALALIAEATDDLRGASNSVTLSVPPSLATKWLVPRLADLAQAYPEIVLQTLASEGLADFTTDGVDLAIRQGHPPFGPGLEAAEIAPLRLVALCSPALADRIGPITGLGDFTQATLVQDGHRHWDQLFHDAGLRAQGRIIQFNQTALAMDAAAGGQGVALAPVLLAQGDLATGRLVPLWQAPEQGSGGFYLVHPAAQKPHAARDRLRDWIVAVSQDGVGHPC